jgi:hypothetical protein
MSSVPSPQHCRLYTSKCLFLAQYYSGVCLIHTCPHNIIGLLTYFRWASVPASESRGMALPFLGWKRCKCGPSLSASPAHNAAPSTASGRWVPRPQAQVLIAVLLYWFVHGSHLTIVCTVVICRSHFHRKSFECFHPHIFAGPMLEADYKMIRKYIAAVIWFRSWLLEWYCE